MAKRKKGSNRKKEILKAQKRTRKHRSTNIKPDDTSNTKTEKIAKKTHTYELPIKLIKKDISKTLVYAVFSFAILTGLNHFNVTYTDILSLGRNFL